jgi:hypothetical protein
MIEICLTPPHRKDAETNPDLPVIRRCPTLSPAPERWLASTAAITSTIGSAADNDRPAKTNPSKAIEAIVIKRIFCFSQIVNKKMLADHDIT